MRKEKRRKLDEAGRIAEDELQPRRELLEQYSMGRVHYRREIREECCTFHQGIAYSSGSSPSIPSTLNPIRMSRVYITQWIELEEFHQPTRTRRTLVAGLVLILQHQEEPGGVRWIRCNQTIFHTWRRSKFL